MYRVVSMGAVILICLLAIGCARKPDALYGTWKIDLDKQVEVLRGQTRFQQIPNAAEKKKAEDTLRKELENSSMTFTASTISTKIGASARDIDYTMITSSGDTWTMQAKQKSGKVENFSVTWVDDDHITLAGPAGEKFYLTRSK